MSERAFPVQTDADRPELVELFVEFFNAAGLLSPMPSISSYSSLPSFRQVSLVDFGATREYTKEFMDNWLHLLQAAASGDRTACVDWSLKLRYITGEENEVRFHFLISTTSLILTSLGDLDHAERPR